MHSPDAQTKRPRRVSFASPNSPSTTKPAPNLQPNLKSKSATNHNTGPAPCLRPSSSNSRPISQATGPAIDNLAGIFTHTVTNTPQGLVVDGVLRPRGATHSDLRDTLPQPFPNSSIPPYFHTTAQPQVNMSTVGAGLMPNPYAAHYQPPVPDTTNGPFQHTYVPRTDAYGPQYMMPNGFAAPSGPPFYAPPAFPYQQPQPGITTAPIPLMASGPQPPFMQPHPMQGPPINFQPGPMPPMAVPGGPAYVANGIGSTPPMTPPTPYFGGGNLGGFEMGKTKNELDAENRYNAQHNQMNEPQGIKPADDDISRMYWCRELDGQWVSRSRFSLDRMGNFRWYVSPDGVFYAKMLVE
ncbi:hypothetical protein F4803DRAFT_573022 [Xylaria telfairii]|nr:hypothetical protein F4803DRAFT_573022 [Xylaria telfairii]